MTAPHAIAVQPLPWPLVLISILVCLLASGFFSGCETGLMSVSRVRLHHATRGNQDRRVRTLQDQLHRLEEAILTCLIGTNLFNVLASAVMTLALTARYGARGEWLTMIVMSTLIIFFGEILPKILYREYPERLTLASTPIIAATMLVMAPVIWLLRLYSGLWRRFLPRPDAAASRELSRRSMSALLLAHTQPGSQDLHFRQSVQKFLALANMTLGQIMRPLARVVSVRRDISLGACLDIAVSSGYSHLPVTDADGAQPFGWISVRDLLFQQDGEAWAEGIPAALVRTCPVVDAAMTPYELFEDLEAQGESFALVADREGRILGMVTEEDLIELVVGSIQDEFDLQEYPRAGQSGQP